MRALLGKIRSALGSRSFLNRYLFSKSFRVTVSLLLSLIFNTTYLGFNLISGIVYRSPAFIAVSVYYALLLSIRYIILSRHDTGEDIRGELLACRKGGILLLLTDVLITVMIFCSALVENEKNYSALVFVFLSCHAVFTVISAGVGIYLGKRDSEPIHKAAYSVRIASSAMSFFNLTSAAVSKFVTVGAIAEILKLFLCAIVSFTVLFLAFSMMFSSSHLERNKNNEKI